jgi:predicted RNA binding protein YcfA (HicA-like mRNA interferase family)
MSETKLKKLSEIKVFVKYIESLGYTESSKNGSSHRIFKCEGKNTLSVPSHNGNRGIIAIGTLRGLVKLLN